MQKIYLTRISLHQIVHSFLEQITAMEIITIIKRTYEDNYMKDSKTTLPSRLSIKSLSINHALVCTWVFSAQHSAFSGAPVSGNDWLSVEGNQLLDEQNNRVIPLFYGTQCKAVRGDKNEIFV